MREVRSPADLLAEHLHPSGKAVVEVGCGTGELVRWLTVQGAHVVGVDLAEMLAQARAFPRAGGEAYVLASGESLPLPHGWADLILYFASLHHLPPGQLDQAMRECRRVLKRGGQAMFIEPVYRLGSYGDITRLVEDEAEVHRLAYEAILGAAASGLEMVREEPFFMARSFADYRQLLDTFVPDEPRRTEILEQARAITERRAAEAGIAFEEYRYRSVCRLNIMLARPLTSRNAVHGTRAGACGATARTPR